MLRSFLQWMSLLLIAQSWSVPAWCQQPGELAVVTFNVRYDNPDDLLTWDQRKERLLGSVSYFDLLGFQEALSHQVSFLASGLPEHDHYGVGRDDGALGGEFCPIFWRRSRFDMLHAETLWLSPTPKVVGSIGWDAVLPRVATIVVLHDRQTDKVFRVVNAHFSHVGEQARLASAQMISSRISGSQADVNLVLGDLNAEPKSPALDMLTSGRLSDAHDLAQKRCRSGIGTFTGFRTGGLRGAPRIDHILVDGGDVLWYCTEEQIMDGFYISDHLPVYIALMP
jgi:endonuclease/exonuclease/phosphatase family metal-dependent hydrolase